jgi:hypothetical protein
VVGVFSGHDMVVAGAGEAPVWCLQGGRRSVPFSPSEAVWNLSVESPIMARGGDGGPLQVDPMMAASEPSLLGERLRPLKQLVMNSRLPKQMVSPREKPPHDRCSPLVVMANVDDGTIRTEGPWRRPEGWG